MNNSRSFSASLLIRRIRHRANRCWQSITLLPQSKYNVAGPVPYVRRFSYTAPSRGQDSYSPVLVGPTTILPSVVGAEPLRGALSVLERLEPDDYVRYTMAYYREGLHRFGDDWHYADIVTVLYGLAQVMQPENYLEIGVRRGRSMAMVAAHASDCQIVGFDLWIQDYSGMPNPGPDFVRQEMQEVGYQGQLELVSGDSHKTVRRYFQDHPDMFFDMITVDGDHSRIGAAQDLADVLPHLKIGGVVVFDDISHPKHPELGKVWQRMVSSNRGFSTWEFDELGYGVAFGVRKW